MLLSIIGSLEAEPEARVQISWFIGEVLVGRGECANQAKAVEVRSQLDGALAWSHGELWSTSCTQSCPTLRQGWSFIVSPALHSSDINQGLTCRGWVCPLGKRASVRSRAPPRGGGQQQREWVCGPVRGPGCGTSCMLQRCEENVWHSILPYSEPSGGLPYHPEKEPHFWKRLPLPVAPGGVNFQLSFLFKQQNLFWTPFHISSACVEAPTFVVLHFYSKDL